MDADHSHICKFGDPNGDDYWPVWTSISKMSKEAVEKSKARANLNVASKLPYKARTRTYDMDGTLSTF